MFADDKDVAKVRDAMFDPFEYLMLRHKGGLLNTTFKEELGDIAYQVACHLRVQNMGLKTRIIGVNPQYVSVGHWTLLRARRRLCGQKWIPRYRGKDR